MSGDMPMFGFWAQTLDKNFLADGFGIWRVKLFSESHSSMSHPAPPCQEIQWPLGAAERKAELCLFMKSFVSSRFQVPEGEWMPTAVMSVCTSSESMLSTHFSISFKMLSIMENNSLVSMWFSGKMSGHTYSLCVLDDVVWAVTFKWEMSVYSSGSLNIWSKFVQTWAFLQVPECECSL